MIRSTTGDTGDGAVRGTTPDTGAVIHGIRTTPDGTEGSTLIGITLITVMEDRDSEAEDTSRPRHGTDHATRLRPTAAYSPTAAGRQSDAASVQAAAQAAEPSEEARHHAAALQLQNHPEAIQQSEGQSPDRMQPYLQETAAQNPGRRHQQTEAYHTEDLPYRQEILLKEALRR